jgi:hypothetical protein
VGCWEH